MKSPGVPAEAEPVRAGPREPRVPVWSEVELAYALFPNPFDAITGTNGKTTTTALLGHLFATAGRPARVLGNIGTAVTSVAGASPPTRSWWWKCRASSWRTCTPSVRPWACS